MIRAALILLAAGLAPLGGAAFAHSWYSQDCCSGKDCAPIEASAVTFTPNGYMVELRPGDHIKVITFPVVELVPFDSVHPSEDDQFHACIRAEAPPHFSIAPLERVICLYVPEGQFGA